MKSKDAKNQILSVKVIVLFSRIIKNNSLPSWLVMLLSEGGLVTLHPIVWVLIFPQSQSEFEVKIFLWAYWGALIAGFIVIFVEKNLELFLSITDELLLLIESTKRQRFEEWKTSTFSLSKQLLFSTAFAIIIFPMTYLFFRGTVGATAINFGSPLLFVNLTLIGNGFYWLIFLPGATRKLTGGMRKLNLFDPKNTYWINQLSGIYGRAATSASIIGVMIFFPLVFGPKANDIIIITSVWLFLVWSLVLIPYLIAQTSIADFINKERLETLSNIQLKISNVLKDSPSEEGEKRLTNLIAIYDKAIKAKSSIFDIDSQIINSLILPLISFILVNFEKIKVFFSRSDKMTNES